ncbi:hypothetical protein BCR34DRAFT_591092 [Clohesyomyces aquaticus]|uniref:Uncharacterized protein n=1 Tax=Clohesyomyces aquaticus TaxID=1231657 RepID=A0A1Y1Z3H6_9PLEO|nr:hypothetical protein BCR34DRAFT_591092 [Clohesyomyces aquaticus]
MQNYGRRVDAMTSIELLGLDRRFSGTSRASTASPLIHITKYQSFNPDTQREVQIPVDYVSRERYGNTKVEHLETKCEECCNSDDETESSNSASRWEKDQQRMYDRVPDDHRQRLRAMVQKSLEVPNVIHEEALGEGSDFIVHRFKDKDELPWPPKFAQPEASAPKTTFGSTSVDGLIYPDQREGIVRDRGMRVNQESRKSPGNYVEIVDDVIAQAVRGQAVSQDIDLPDRSMGHLALRKSAEN